jgi:hypothetical protein
LSLPWLENNQTHNQCLQKNFVTNTRDKQRRPKGIPMKKPILIGNFPPLWHQNTKKENKHTNKDGKEIHNQACKNQQGKQSLDETPQNHGEKERATK